MRMDRTDGTRYKLAFDEVFRHHVGGADGGAG